MWNNVSFLSFVTSAVVCGKCSASRPGCFPTGKALLLQVEKQAEWAPHVAQTLRRRGEPRFQASTAVSMRSSPFFDFT
jgi:hypothetical protein